MGDSANPQPKVLQLQLVLVADHLELVDRVRCEAGTLEFVQLQLESPVGRGTRWDGWETLLGLIRRRLVGVDDEGTVREIGMVEEVETADLEKCEKSKIG